MNIKEIQHHVCVCAHSTTMLMLLHNTREVLQWHEQIREGVGTAFEMTFQ